MCTCRHIYRHPFPGIQNREVLTFPGMDSEEARNDGRRHNETNPGATFGRFFSPIHSSKGSIQWWGGIVGPFCHKNCSISTDFQTGPAHNQPAADFISYL